MKVELSGRAAAVTGEDGPVADAVRSALGQQGARLVEAEGADLLVVCHDLVEGCDRLRAATLDDLSARHGGRMREGAGGRIVALLPAFALLPMRRRPEASSVAAASAARLRALSMTLAPKVLVNGIAAGPVAGPSGLVAGEEAMISHTALKRAAALDDLVAAVLFLCDEANGYTTGQVLAVDAGWSVGFARDF